MEPAAPAQAALRRPPVTITGVKPRSWAPHRTLASVVAALLVALLPLLTTRTFTRASQDIGVPYPFLVVFPALAAASFARADRRAPLVGATVVGISFVTRVQTIDDLDSIAASDAQGALVYLLVPIVGAFAVALAGWCAWLADAVLRRALTRPPGADRVPPYR